MTMSLDDILSFGVFLAICAAAASSGAVFKRDPWYSDLRKPCWCPPDWLFPVAWSVLYLTIALAGWVSMAC